MIPKFRAWFDSEMYDKPVVYDGEFYLDWREFENGETYNGAVLMQSTGMFDKNGNEIFEGDIVKYKLEEKTFTDIASFNKFFACFGLEDDTGDWFCSFDWLLENIKQDDIEAVGNVYENPELLI